MQANPLGSTAGLEGLRSLQVLSLAGTSIDSLAHLEALRPITTLFDLAFDDGPYGAAPIARADGYAASAVHLLPQLGVLDGRAVSAHERSDADEEVLRRSLRLSRWVEACKAESEAAGRKLEAQRQESAAQLRAMRAALGRAFGELREAVTDGLRKVDEEERRFLDAHAASLASLRRELAPLRALYDAEVARLRAVQRARLRQLRRARRILRARAVAQAAVQRALLELQLRAEGRVYAVPLAPADAEAAFVRAKAEADAPLPPDAPRPAVPASKSVLSCHRLYVTPPRLAADALALAESGATALAAAAAAAPLGGSQARWRWACGPFAQLGAAWLQAAAPEHAEQTPATGAGAAHATANPRAVVSTAAAGPAGPANGDSTARARLCVALDAASSWPLSLPPLPAPGAGAASGAASGGGGADGAAAEEEEDDDDDDEGEEAEEEGSAKGDGVRGVPGVRGVSLCAALLCRDAREGGALHEPPNGSDAGGSGGGEALRVGAGSEGGVRGDYVPEYLVLYELCTDADAVGAGRAGDPMACLHRPEGWGTEKQAADALRAEAASWEAGWRAGGWLDEPVAPVPQQPLSARARTSSRGAGGGVAAAAPAAAAREAAGTGVEGEQSAANGRAAAAAARQANEQAASLAAQQACEWALLLQLEGAAEREFSRYQQQLWSLAHPPTAHALAAGAERTSQLQVQLAQVYEQIRQERAQQQSLLEQLEARSPSHGAAAPAAAAAAPAAADSDSLTAAMRAAQRAAAAAHRRAVDRRLSAPAPPAAAAPTAAPASNGADGAPRKPGRPEWVS